jgi:hypothetical protein
MSLHITKTFISVTPSDAALHRTAGLQAAIAVTQPKAVALPPSQLHVTVCSFGSLKPHREILKAWVGKESSLPSAPEVVLVSSAELQVVGERWSWAAQLQLQPEWHSWRKELLREMGFADINLDSERVFHLSLANKDGSPFSSVGPAFEEGIGQGILVSL